MKHNALVHKRDMPLLADALTTGLFFSLCLSLYIFLSFRFNMPHLYVSGYLLLIPGTGALFLRRRKLSFILQIILHTLLALLPAILLPWFQFDTCILLMAVNFLFMYLSLTLLFQRELLQLALLLVVMSVFMQFVFTAIIAFNADGFHTVPYYAASGLMAIGLYIAIRQMLIFRQAYGRFLTSETQPGRTIEAHNKKVIILLLLFSVFIVPLVFFVPYQRIGALFIAVLSVLVNAFFDRLGDRMTTVETAIQATQPAEGTPLPASDFVLPFDALMEKLDLILYTLALVVLLASMVFILFKLLMFLRRLYAVPQRSTIPDQALLYDEISDLKITRHPKTLRHNFGSGYEKKVRKNYYRAVRQAKKAGVNILSSDTPGAIEQRIFEKTNVDISELTRLYQRVRYGPGPN